MLAKNCGYLLLTNPPPQKKKIKTFAKFVLLITDFVSLGQDFESSIKFSIFYIPKMAYFKKESSFHLLEGPFSIFDTKICFRKKPLNI